MKCGVDIMSWGAALNLYLLMFYNWWYYHGWWTDVGDGINMSTTYSSAI